jgi:dipeptidyl aminopeptidase/acylaminoacyl peptidase
MRLLRLVAALSLVPALALAADPAPGSLRKEGTQVRLPKPPGSLAAVVAPSVERYLNIRSAVTPELSASGRRLAFRTAITGQNQVWMIDRPGAWPTQVTFGTEPIGSFTWSPVDDDRMIFTRDVGGNERRQLYLADVATGDVRRLTTRDDVIHNWGGWSRDGRRITYSSNERNQAFFDVYVMDVESGVARRVLERDGSNYSAGFSPDGARVLVADLKTPSDVDLWLVDAEGTAAPRRLTPEGQRARYSDSAWMPDGASLWVTTDRGREFMSLARIDVATGVLAFRDSLSWDIADLALSEDGRMLATVVNEDGRGRLVVRDLRLRSADQAVPVPELPDGTVSDLAWSRDGTRLAFALSGPQHPSDAWVFDRTTKTVTRWTDSWTAGIPRESFVGSRVVHFDSFDGTRIAGFLYLPPGAAGRPVPILFNVHGGPESQAEAVFSPLIQYFVQRGFGVYSPNVRGSTGYGKSFAHLDDVGKRLDSVRDLASAAEWLVAQGIAEPGRIAVSGGSYGGYMTLAALAFHPEVWACGVDIVGISNLRTFIANTGAWRQSLRAAEYGDPEKDGAAMDAASPIHKVADIRAPLMVIQGANDPRVPQSEADQMVEAMRARGATVEYLLYPDEGHGLAKLPNRITAYTKMADFLAAHLLGPAPTPATP